MFVQTEATRRGYRFDAGKIGAGGGSGFAPLKVSRGQIDYEWTHLRAKLQTRAPSWLAHFDAVRRPRPHPLFRVVAGGVADWEVAAS